MNKILVGLTSVALMATSALPISALAWGSDIVVTNSNYANVSNGVTVAAYTGDNHAVGGNGGDGGWGSTANGGNGGSNSGDIRTGDAYAKAKVVNIVNTNKTKVKTTCSWFCPDVDDVVVTNGNNASVGNGVDVLSDTGMNNAYGGIGGNGGMTFLGTANGGAGGSNNAGDITTGDAYAKAKVVNIVNKNITRIRR